MNGDREGAEAEGEGAEAKGEGAEAEGGGLMGMLCDSVTVHNNDDMLVMMLYDTG